MTKSAAQRPPRSRTGCFTCRKRKKRCDESRPLCGACSRLGLDCVYPTPGLERKNRKHRRPADPADPRGPDDLRRPSTILLPKRLKQHSPESDATDDTEASDELEGDMDPVDAEFGMAIGISTGADDDGRKLTSLAVAHAAAPTSQSAPPPAAALYPNSLASSGHNLSFDSLTAVPLSLTGLWSPPSSPGDDSESSSEHVEDRILDGHSAATAQPGVDHVEAPSPLPMDHEDIEEIVRLGDSDLDPFSLSPRFASPSSIQGFLTQSIADSLGTDSASTTALLPFGPPSPPDGKGAKSSAAVNWEAFTVGLNLTSPTSPWYSAYLDPEGERLFEHFCSRLGKIICVSNDEANSFLNVFVPMAQHDRIVLDSIVAWSGFHLGRDNEQDAASFYLNRAIQSVRAKPKRRNDYTTIAGILLICAAEICSGDVVNWDQHLGQAAGLIKLNGGIKSFAHDRSLRWLASNFAYHDLLTSTTRSRNTYFAASEYDPIMKHGLGLDALLGCCRPLFKLLAEITDFSARCYSLSDPENLVAQQISNRVRELDQRLESCHADPLDMISLTAEQLESQLALFDTIKVTARLHLRQSVLKVNAASLEAQSLVKQLHYTLDVVLGTEVEGMAVFPLFIAAIHSVTDSDRHKVNKMFDDYYGRNLARNIARTRELVNEVWSRDDYGTSYVDWYGICNSKGWDISFA